MKTIVGDNRWEISHRPGKKKPYRLRDLVTGRKADFATLTLASTEAEKWKAELKAKKNQWMPRQLRPKE